MKPFLRHSDPCTLLALTAVLLAGCTSLPPANVESFASGVSAARNQTRLAFQAVSDLTSESIIDYAAAQTTLTDTNFLPGRLTPKMNTSALSATAVTASAPKTASAGTNSGDHQFR